MLFQMSSRKSFNVRKSLDVPSGPSGGGPGHGS